MNHDRTWTWQTHLLIILTWFQQIWSTWAFEPLIPWSIYPCSTVSPISLPPPPSPAPLGGARDGDWGIVGGKYFSAKRLKKKKPPNNQRIVAIDKKRENWYGNHRHSQLSMLVRVKTFSLPCTNFPSYMTKAFRLHHGYGKLTVVQTCVGQFVRARKIRMGTGSRKKNYLCVEEQFPLFSFVGLCPSFPFAPS